VFGEIKTKYYKINTIGTQNVVNAAKELGIKTLVYTSTPSVVFDFGDIENGDESIPISR
jgi:nucleoside-diphosphate-sugar epimerase